MPFEFMREQLGDPRRRFGGLKRQHAAAVVVEREADIAPRHRQPLHRIEAGGIFRPRAAHELAPCRDLVEQALDADSGSGWKRGRTFGDFFAMVDLDPPTVGAPGPAFESQPRDARDRRQRFAAEAEAGHLVDGIPGQLRRGVPLEREPHFVRAHSAAVVGDLNSFRSATAKADRDVACASVE